VSSLPAVLVGDGRHVLIRLSLKRIKRFGLGNI
jgi:hypothetical protein